ncbi:MAG TPA: class I SAM-dependent methyltransferase [Lacibacter sp.]|nr:class I SAM-dependent methyltransferase [Lacibacter sp.]HMO89424.1 class I SAM-dependent methyltransferase [Lacibacter sp.]
MLAEKLLMFQNRLQKVYRHRSKQARRLGITCYRLYDRDLPEFPVSIDLYGTRACMSEYRAKHHLTPEEHMEWLEGTVTVVATVLQIPEEAVYTKERRRKTDRFSQYQKTDSAGDFFEVQEGGLPFIVNLTDYLDTGLFLDHRITRDMVRSEATGKRVLNLFAYTGSFSVYAAAGGASYVETVDLSNTYIDWARRNFQGNGFSDPLRYRFVVADVLQFVQTLPDHAFDVVVMDPPTFSNSKKMKDILDIQRDHVALINRVLQAIRPGGVLYFSTNARRFVLGETAIRAQEIRDITRATTPFDFEGKLQRWCWRMVR